MSNLLTGAAGMTQSNHTTTATVLVTGNSIFIWLDSNIDASDEDCHSSLTQLQRIVTTIKTFTDADQCVNFLRQIKNEKVFMIVSGSLGESIVPLIHDMSQLDSIYVFCGNKSRHEQWAKNWSKVKGVFIQIAPICELLRQAAQECHQVSMPVTFPTASNASHENSDHLDPSFMYTKIIKEILLEIKYDEQSIKDFTDYCRHQYPENASQLNNIAEFEREYRERSPIWWYTSACHIYSMLNRATRTQDMSTMITMGFFIRDLHRQIEQLYSEQSGEYRGKSLTVYRGQGMSTADFEKLMKTRGGLLSFNNFLSTCSDREVSFAFAESNADNPDMVGIIFEIAIDTSVSTVPFALIDNVSCYPDSGNREILFSMHTVFRIGEIKQINDRLWQVQLTLTNDSDQQLDTLAELIREETQGATGWHRLGELLIKIGEFNTAEQVYKTLLNQISDDAEKASIYHQLGRIQNLQGNYSEAIGFYEKSLEIYQRTLPPNHPLLATSYNNISAVYGNMGQHSSALSFCEKALEIRQKTLPPNHPEVAISYNNIGLLYSNMNENSKALSFYEKALEIRQKTLPPDHPDLAQTYNDFGSLYYNMEQYSQALTFYERAVDIGQRSLPPNHPNLELWQSNLELVKTRL